jgi:hypothetical protein
MAGQMIRDLLQARAAPGRHFSLVWVPGHAGWSGMRRQTRKPGAKAWRTKRRPRWTSLRLKPLSRRKLGEGRVLASRRRWMRNTTTVNAAMVLNYLEATPCRGVRRGLFVFFEWIATRTAWRRWSGGGAKRTQTGWL